MHSKAVARISKFVLVTHAKFELIFKKSFIFSKSLYALLI